jgi:hypothetical protein
MVGLSRVDFCGEEALVGLDLFSVFVVQVLRRARLRGWGLPARNLNRSESAVTG